MPSIVLKINGNTEQTIKLTTSSIVVGRNDNCDIRINSNLVSRTHARIEMIEDGWFYTDLESRNGSWINGERIQKIKLEKEMIVEVGGAKTKATLIFIDMDQERGPAENNPEYTYEPTISFIDPTKRVLIGRGSNADIQLLSPMVSRAHASIETLGNRSYIIDLNSKNGTFLNGKRVKEKTAIKFGDGIQIGPFNLVFDQRGIVQPNDPKAGYRIDGRGIYFIVAGGKKILNNIDINIMPSEFVALVGGSGAGKSTLMKSLSGLLPIQGDIRIQGENLYAHYDAYRAMIGYVPQDDILHSELKVIEALEYSAKLRLPSDTSDEEISNRIRTVLKQVELSGQKDQLISSLSGGQRKRASIAVELLADPPLFFLDEPTSGLDPGLEKKVMKILRKLADSGKTIILVTHATANINECHKVAFMSHGRLVYYGPPTEACGFFSVTDNDFAEIYNEISDPDPDKALKQASNWENKYKSSRYHKAVRSSFHTDPNGSSLNERPKPIPITFNGILNQTGFMIKRYFSLIFRDKTLLGILLGLMPLLGLLILTIVKPHWLVGESAQQITAQLEEKILNGEKAGSYLIVSDAQRLLFIMGLTAVMLGLFSSSYEIVKERSIYMRERMVFLKLGPYLASKLIPLGAFGLVQTLLFMIVISFKVKFPSTGVFMAAELEMFITLYLAVLASITMGLFISSIAKNENTVTYMILGILFVQITFAGVIFNLPGVTKNLSSVTITRWTMQALGISDNLEQLNDLSVTRYHPEAMSREVEFDYEKPDPKWEPVTITYEEKMIPGCSQAIEFPVITENKLKTVKETSNETVEIDDIEPVEIKTPYSLTLNYEYSKANLLTNWGILGLYSMLFILGSNIALKRKDVI